MRLIDVNVLKKRFNEEIRDMVAEEDKTCFLYATELVDSIQTEKAIPIEWLQREMVNLIYDGEKVTDKDRYIINKLIAKWEKQNDR